MDELRKEVHVTPPFGLVGVLVRRNVVSPAEARTKAKFPENFPG